MTTCVYIWPALDDTDFIISHTIVLSAILTITMKCTRELLKDYVIWPWG